MASICDFVATAVVVRSAWSSVHRLDGQLHGQEVHEPFAGVPNHVHRSGAARSSNEPKGLAH